MPSKNKPKRLDRFRSWRVARRKKRRSILVSGGGRTRKPRPKHKAKIEVEAPKEKAVALAKKAAAKKVTKVAPEKAEELLDKIAVNNGKE